MWEQSISLFPMMKNNLNWLLICNQGVITKKDCALSDYDGDFVAFIVYSEDGLVFVYNKDTGAFIPPNITIRCLGKPFFFYRNTVVPGSGVHYRQAHFGIEDSIEIVDNDGMLEVRIL